MNLVDGLFHLLAVLPEGIFVLLVAVVIVEEFMLFGINGIGVIVALLIWSVFSVLYLEGLNREERP